MIRAVLDANVIVSAVLTTVGIPAQVLDAWRTERFTLLVSSAILEEVTRVLEYPLDQGVAQLEAVFFHQLLVEVLDVEIEVTRGIELDHARGRVHR